MEGIYAQNKDYGKLVDGKLIHPKKAEIIGDRLYINPTAEQYLMLGYKRIVKVKVDSPEVREGYYAYPSISYKETDTDIVEENEWRYEVIKPIYEHKADIVADFAGEELYGVEHYTKEEETDENDKT